MTHDLEQPNQKKNGGNKHSSPWLSYWVQLKNHKTAKWGLLCLFLITITSFVAPIISPYNPNAQDLITGATSPNLQHWFGTDTLGRDLLSRILHGGRISLAVGFSATMVSMTIGVAWGAISGYTGGWIDHILMRIVDILYSLPFVIFVILLMTVFERSIFILFIAIGFVEWLTLSRIVRSQILHLKTMPYIDAARCLGVSHTGILVRHLIPNLMSQVIIYVTLTIPAVMLLESSLSFLGLGVQPPNSSWGSLISEGADKITTYPWLLIFPSAFFSLTLLSLNLIGDALRDILDPKEQE